MNKLMIWFGLFSVPVGIFCASDLWWETFGRGNPFSWAVVGMGLAMAALGAWYEYGDKNARKG